jgi:death-on-curing protein
VTVFLTKEDVLALAEEVLPKVVVRDAGQLHTAVLRPQTVAFGEDAYPDLWTKAAALMHSLVMGHPLLDGNERLGWVATVIFLELNGEDLAYTDMQTAYELVIAAAAGELEDVPEIARRLREL